MKQVLLNKVVNNHPHCLPKPYSLLLRVSFIPKCVFCARTEESPHLSLSSPKSFTGDLVHKPSSSNFFIGDPDHTSKLSGFAQSLGMLQS